MSSSIWIFFDFPLNVLKTTTGWTTIWTGNIVLSPAPLLNQGHCVIGCDKCQTHYIISQAVPLQSYSSGLSASETIVWLQLKWRTLAQSVQSDLSSQQHNLVACDYINRHSVPCVHCHESTFSQSHMEKPFASQNNSRLNPVLLITNTHY